MNQSLAEYNNSANSGNKKNNSRDVEFRSESQNFLCTLADFENSDDLDENTTLIRINEKKSLNEPNALDINGEDDQKEINQMYNELTKRDGVNTITKNETVLNAETFTLNGSMANKQRMSETKITVPELLRGNWEQQQRSTISNGNNYNNNNNRRNFDRIGGNVGGHNTNHGGNTRFQPYSQRYGNNRYRSNERNFSNGHRFNGNGRSPNNNSQQSFPAGNRNLNANNSMSTNVSQQPWQQEQGQQHQLQQQLQQQKLQLQQQEQQMQQLQQRNTLLNMNSNNCLNQLPLVLPLNTVGLSSNQTLTGINNNNMNQINGLNLLGSQPMKVMNLVQLPNGQWLDLNSATGNVCLNTNMLNNINGMNLANTNLNSGEMTLLNANPGMGNILNLNAGAGLPIVANSLGVGGAGSLIAPNNNSALELASPSTSICRNKTFNVTTDAPKRQNIGSVLGFSQNQFNSESMPRLLHIMKAIMNKDVTIKIVPKKKD